MVVVVVVVYESNLETIRIKNGTRGLFFVKTMCVYYVGEKLAVISSSR